MIGEGGKPVRKEVPKEEKKPVGEGEGEDKGEGEEPPTDLIKAGNEPSSPASLPRKATD